MEVYLIGVSIILTAEVIKTLVRWIYKRMINKSSK